MSPLVSIVVIDPLYVIKKVMTKEWVIWPRQGH